MRIGQGLYGTTFLRRSEDPRLTHLTAVALAVPEATHCSTPHQSQKQDTRPAAQNFRGLQRPESVCDP